MLNLTIYTLDKNTMKQANLIGHHLRPVEGAEFQSMYPGYWPSLHGVTKDNVS